MADKIVSKTISILLVFCLLGPGVSWAFEASSYAMPTMPGAVYEGNPIIIPEKLGKIESACPGKDKTIICIEDLHCNYEVQMNIAGIINTLAKDVGAAARSPLLVGEEGGNGKIDLTPLRGFPVEGIRQDVSKYFVKQGRLTGAEYYGANGKYGIELNGIETPSLYAESLAAVKSFLNAETQGLILDLRDAMDSIKPAAGSGSEALWQEQSRRLNILEKMLNISALPQEVGEYQSQRQKFSMASFLKFFEKAGLNAGFLPMEDASLLAQRLNSVERFYQLTDERSRELVNNLIQEMDRRHERIAAMIVGGFHRGKILQALESRGVGYISIRPALTKPEVLNPYFDVLQGRKMPIEQLLEKSQRNLAAPSWPQQAGYKPSVIVTEALAAKAGPKLLSALQEEEIQASLRDIGIRRIRLMTRDEAHEFRQPLEKGCRGGLIIRQDGSRGLALFAVPGYVFVDKQGVMAIGRLEMKIFAGKEAITAEARKVKHQPASRRYLWKRAMDLFALTWEWLLTLPAAVAGRFGKNGWKDWFTNKHPVYKQARLTRMLEEMTKRLPGSWYWAVVGGTAVFIAALLAGQEPGTAWHYGLASFSILGLMHHHWPHVKLTIFEPRFAGNILDRDSDPFRAVEDEMKKKMRDHGAGHHVGEGLEKTLSAFKQVALSSDSQEQLSAYQAYADALAEMIIAMETNGAGEHVRVALNRDIPELVRTAGDKEHVLKAFLALGTELAGNGAGEHVEDALRYAIPVLVRAAAERKDPEAAFKAYAQALGELIIAMEKHDAGKQVHTALKNVIPTLARATAEQKDPEAAFKEHTQALSELIIGMETHGAGQHVQTALRNAVPDLVQAGAKQKDPAEAFKTYAQALDELIFAMEINGARGHVEKTLSEAIPELVWAAGGKDYIIKDALALGQELANNGAGEFVENTLCFAIPGLVEAAGEQSEDRRKKAFAVYMAIFRAEMLDMVAYGYPRNKVMEIPATPLSDEVRHYVAGLDYSQEKVVFDLDHARSLMYPSLGLVVPNIAAYEDFLPPGQADLVRGKSERDLLRGINTRTIAEGDHPVILFALFKHSYPWEEMDLDKFKEILEHKDWQSDEGGKIARFLREKGISVIAKISDEELENLIHLSVELDGKIVNALGKTADEADQIQFRELVRFSLDFRRHYQEIAKSGQAGMVRRIIGRMLIAADMTYGRAISDQEKRKHFIKILWDTLREDQSGLLGTLSSGWPELASRPNETIENVINYGDYENPERYLKFTGKEILAKERMKALIRRGQQSRNAVLIKYGDDTAGFFQEAVRELSEEKGNRIGRLAIHPFSQRQELFGMYMAMKKLGSERVEEILSRAGPNEIHLGLKDVLHLQEEEYQEYINQWDSNEDMRRDKMLREALAWRLAYPKYWRKRVKWQAGVLEQANRMAAQAPHTKYTLILENINAGPGDMRLALHPVLWERWIDGREMEPNFTLVLGMHEDEQIRDDAFMNRPMVHNVTGMEAGDDKRVLMSLGLESETADRLLKSYHELKNEKLGETPGLQWVDVEEIGRRIAGRAREKGVGQASVYGQELGLFLKARINANDWANPEVKKHFAFKEKEPALVIKDGMLVVHGAGVKLGAALAEKYAGQEKRGDEVRDIIQRETGYMMTDYEEYIWAQMVRQVKYGQVPLHTEGLSGEGKTTGIWAFSKMIGYEIHEITVGEGMELEELSGQPAVEPSGAMSYEEADYSSHLGQAKKLYLFNESNSQKNAATYYYLVPEQHGWREKPLPEQGVGGKNAYYASQKIAQNSLWMHTVNITEGEPPSGVKCRMLRLQMELPAEAVRQAIRREFEQAGLREYMVYAEKLWKFHQSIRTQLKQGKLLSPQVVSRREIRQAVNEFQAQLKQTPDDPDKAFEKALEMTYLYMWQQGEDEFLVFRHILAAVKSPMEAGMEAGLEALPQLAGMRKVGQSLRQMLGLHPDIREPLISAKEALKNAVHHPDQSSRPLMVLHEGSMSAAGIEKMIKAKDPQADIHVIPVSRYHDADSWYGGWTARQKGESGEQDQTAKWRKRLRQSGLEMGLGILAELILCARLSPNQQHYAIIPRYSRLDGKMASGLNEFWQTGMISKISAILTMENAEDLLAMVREKEHAQPELKSGLLAAWRKAQAAEAEGIADLDKMDQAQKLRFAKWFYGAKPDNVQTIALSHSGDKINIPEAALDRFRIINVGGEVSREGIAAEVDKALPGNKHKVLVTAVINQALELYEKQAGNDDYEHQRLGQEDVNIFLQEVKAIVRPDEQKIKVLAGIILGAGLNPDYRRQYSGEQAWQKKWAQAEQEAEKTGRSLVTFHKEKNKVIMDIAGLEIETRRKALPSPEEEDGFFAETEPHVRQLQVMALAYKYRTGIVVEGPPGSGKTEGFADFAKRMGLEFYKQQMYKSIKLGDILGQLSVQGRKFILTCRNAAGKYLLPFLKAYGEGGVYVADEGSLGENPQETIGYESEVAKMKSFDLGTFLPGLAGEKIRRSSRFMWGVARNSTGTSGRLPELMAVDQGNLKCHTDVIRTEKDARKVIAKALKRYQAGSIPEELQGQLAKVYLLMTDKHSQTEELSPRQMIMACKGLAQAEKAGKALDMALYQGLVAGYLAGLDDVEIEALMPRLREILGEKHQAFEDYLASWDGKIEVVRDNQNRKINVGGIELPMSSHESSNVTREDLDLPPDEEETWRPRAYREIAVKFSLGQNVAVQGDGLDLMRGFARRTGWDLDIAWTDKNTGQEQFIANLVPVFAESFDRYGIKAQQAGRSLQEILGVFLDSMMTEETYQQARSRPQVQKILYFPYFDRVPEEERGVLNEILATRAFEHIGSNGQITNYHLPEWVHIAISHGREHEMSSAFVNRFDRPVQALPMTEADIQRVAEKRYPLLREAEIQWAAALGKKLSAMDEGGQLDQRYGFGDKDILQLCRRLHLEKQADIAKGTFHQNPLYYFLKACYVEYHEALDDEDKEKLMNKILPEFLHQTVYAGRQGDKDFKAVIAQSRANIEKELSEITYLEREIGLDTAGLKKNGDYVRTGQGLVLEKTEDGFKLHTPGNSYPLKAQAAWRKLSDDLFYRKQGTQYKFKVRLVAAIGGMPLTRDSQELEAALPMSETPVKEYVKLTKEAAITYACLLRAWQKCTLPDGREEKQRVVLQKSETGRIKTTGAKNLARLWGIPLIMLQAHGDLESQDMSMGMVYKGGEFKLEQQEIFKALGRVDETSYNMPKKISSGRSLMLVDESNASKIPAQTWAPVISGEKTFGLRAEDGQVHQVNRYPEVKILYTGNPTETHEARYDEGETKEQMAKRNAPDPMKYSKEIKKAILREYHRRDMSVPETEAARIARQYNPWAAKLGKETHHEVVPEYTPIQSWQPPEPAGLEKLIESIGTIAAQSRPAAPVVDEGKRRTVITIPDYDIGRVRQAAGQFTQGQDAVTFCQNIMRGYLLGLVHGEVDAELQTRVQTAARMVSPEVEQALSAITRDLLAGRGDEAEVQEQFLALRRVLAKKGTALFVHWVGIEQADGSKKVYILTYAEKIQRTVVLTDKQLESMGLDSKDFARHPMAVHVVDGRNYPFGRMQGRFDGEQGVVFACDVSKINGVDEQETINVAAYHEALHDIDQWLYKTKKTPYPSNPELHSMLGMLMLSPIALDYLEHEMVPWLKRKQPEDMYIQAIRGILNGLIIYARDHWDMDKSAGLISDEFEDDRIDGIVKLVKAKVRTSAKLNQIACALYKEKEKYLKDVSPGKFKGRIMISANGVESYELISGTEGLEIEMRTEELKAGQVDIVGPEGKVNTTVIRKSQSKEAGEIKRAKEAKEQVRQQENTRPDRPKKRSLSGIIKKCLQTFAQTEEAGISYGWKGRKLNVSRLAREASPLETKSAGERSSLYLHISVDVSRSVRRRLLKTYQAMLADMTDLHHECAIDNKDVAFGFGAIGKHYKSMLLAQNCRQRYQIEHALDEFAGYRDPDGIHIPNLLEKLEDEIPGKGKYKNSIELIYTDAVDISGRSPKQLKEMVRAFEKRKGMDVVFVSVKELKKENCHRWFLFAQEPTVKEMLALNTQIVQLKKQRQGQLPEGDLGEWIKIPQRRDGNDDPPPGGGGNASAITVELSKARSYNEAPKVVVDQNAFADFTPVFQTYLEEHPALMQALARAGKLEYRIALPGWLMKYYEHHPAGHWPAGRIIGAVISAQLKGSRLNRLIRYVKNFRSNPARAIKLLAARLRYNAAMFLSKILPLPITTTLGSLKNLSRAGSASPCLRLITTAMLVVLAYWNRQTMITRREKHLWYFRHLRQVSRAV